MHFSVCIDALYPNSDFCESVRDMQKAGFDTIEFWGWWDKDIQLIEKTLNENDVNMTAFCTKFISLVDEQHRKAYMNGLQESIAIAKKLNCNMLISQVGQEISGVSGEEQKQSVINGLKACAPILEKEAITLVIEPLNTVVDHPGYFLTESAEAFGIIQQVGSSHVKVLYDIYHQQLTEGNVIRTIQHNIDLIGHFHAAGVPGRNELDKGELNYQRIFKAIEETGYKGYVGLEYFPKDEPLEGLKQLASLYNT